MNPSTYFLTLLIPLYKTTYQQFDKQYLADRYALRGELNTAIGHAPKRLLINKWCNYY